MAETTTRRDLLKVVMVGPKTFPPVIGGIETHVYEIATRLARKGHEVEVIVPAGGCRREALAVDNVRVTKVPSLDNRYAQKLSMIPSVMSELGRSKGAIIHAHDATGGYAAALATGGRKFVYTMHGMGFHRSDWPTPFRQGIRMMQIKALSSATHVFCTDEIAAEEASRIRSQVEVLSSGVDVQGFSEIKTQRPAQYENGAFVVLYVGRLAKVKGVGTLIEAVKSIPPERRKGAEFVVIGDGPMRAELEEVAKHIREIVVLGTIEHSKIVPYFQHASAFVLPSLSEGVPMSLLEAMAAGLPAIATNVGGINEQFDPSSIRLVPPNDPASLANAILDLKSDVGRAKALGLRGREFAKERFSWDKVVQKIEETYYRISSS